jgi:hypothetical protein
MEFSDVAIPKPRPTSTGRCVTLKLSKLHLGCFVVFFFVSAFGVSAF